MREPVTTTVAALVLFGAKAGAAASKPLAATLTASRLRRRSRLMDLDMESPLFMARGGLRRSLSLVRARRGRPLAELSRTLRKKITAPRKRSYNHRDSCCATILRNVSFVSHA